MPSHRPAMATLDREPLRFSLVMTTRGGSRMSAVRRLIDSLGEQAGIEFELIVVFQASTVLTAEELVTAHPELNGAKIVVAPFCPLSRARNIGVRYARFEIVAFPDDDCWYPAGLLRGVRDRFARSGLGGLCVNTFDPYRSRTYGKRPLHVQLPIRPSNAFYLPISVGIFVRSNLLAAAAPAGFDEELGVGVRWGAGEESDLICKLLDNGVPMEYDGRLMVYHETSPYLPADVPKYRSYGRGFGAVLGKRVAAGKLSPLLVLADLTLRSVAGILLSAAQLKFVACGVYVNRGRGVVEGFAEAFCHYRAYPEQAR